MLLFFPYLIDSWPTALGTLPIRRPVLFLHFKDSSSVKVLSRGVILTTSSCPCRLQASSYFDIETRLIQCLVMVSYSFPPILCGVQTATEERTGAL